MDKPFEKDIVNALLVVEKAEKYLVAFAEKNGLSVYVGAHLSGAKGFVHYSISAHSPGFGLSDKIFLSASRGGDKPKRNTNTAFASSIDRAEAVILEAAASVAERKKRK